MIQWGGCTSCLPHPQIKILRPTLEAVLTWLQSCLLAKHTSITEDSNWCWWVSEISICQYGIPLQTIVSTFWLSEKVQIKLNKTGAKNNNADWKGNSKICNRQGMLRLCEDTTTTGYLKRRCTLSLTNICVHNYLVEELLRSCGFCQKIHCS